MKKLSFLIIAIFALISSTNIFSQDIIVLKSGDEIKSSIKKISENTITYLNFGEQSPEREISKNKILMVIYEDGHREVFRNSEPAERVEKYFEEDPIRRMNQGVLEKIGPAVVLPGGKVKRIKKVLSIKKFFVKYIDENGKKGKRNYSLVYDGDQFFVGQVEFLINPIEEKNCRISVIDARQNKGILGYERGVIVVGDKMKTKDKENRIKNYMTYFKNRLCEELGDMDLEVKVKTLEYERKLSTGFSQGYLRVYVAVEIGSKRISLTYTSRTNKDAFCMALEEEIKKIKEYIYNNSY